MNNYQLEASVDAGASVRQSAMKRQVFYIAGYDPRGADFYHTAFCQEAAKAAATFDRKIEVSELVDTDAPGTVPHWIVENKTGDQTVSTTFSFLDWHDLAGREFRYSALRRFVVGSVALVDYFRRGTFGKFRRAHWPFSGFLIYTCVMIGVYASLFALGCAGAVLVAASLGASVGLQIIAAAIILVGLYLVTTWLERWLLVYYAINLWISTHRTARNADPDLSERLRSFGEHIAAAARRDEFDEFIIVGHSAGGYLAILALATAFERQPDLGRNGPKIALLTVGSVLPMIGYFEEAGGFRRALTGLVTNRDIFWADYWDASDVITFPDLDPVQSFELDVMAGDCVNPVSRSAQFSQLLSDENFARFRYQVFRLHCQYVMANDRDAEYDFFDIVVGPKFLSRRLSDA